MRTLKNAVGIYVIAVITVMLLGSVRNAGAEEVATNNAEVIFLPGLPPELNEQVRALMKNTPVTIDDATREEIDILIENLAKKHEFVGDDRRRVSSVSHGQLKTVGEAAILQLIAATEHDNKDVRCRALIIICDVSKNKKEESKYLDVYARSLWDKETDVRSTAVAQIGNVCRALQNTSRDDEGLERAIEYLVLLLKDKNKKVRYIAGSYLFRINRRDLVPQELVDEVGLGKEDI